jgi:MtN3 and saliva related transmembrane protein
VPWLELTGYLAGIFTTFAVVPQIWKAWKTRHVADISLMMVVVLLCGLGLWVTYGVLTASRPIIVTNGLSFLLNCFLLGLVLYERRQGH